MCKAESTIRITRTKSGGTVTTKVNALHADGLGSVRAVTDATGAAVERTTYRPYGEEVRLAQPLTLPETKGFIGERYDDGSGLQYLNARYYDPRLGMFVQPDWWEVTRPGVGTNRYSYSFNDPVNGRDPGGHAKCGDTISGSDCKDALDASDKERELNEKDADMARGLAEKLEKDGTLSNNKATDDFLERHQKSYGNLDADDLREIARQHEIAARTIGPRGEGVEIHDLAGWESGLLAKGYSKAEIQSAFDRKFGKTQFVDIHGNVSNLANRHPEAAAWAGKGVNRVFLDRKWTTPTNGRHASRLSGRYFTHEVGHIALRLHDFGYGKEGIAAVFNQGNGLEWQNADSLACSLIGC